MNRSTLSGMASIFVEDLALVNFQTERAETKF